MSSAQPAADRSSITLQDALATQSWTWLSTRVDRLGVALEFVTDAGVIGPRVASAPASAALRQLLASPTSPVLRSALPAALLSGQHQRLSFDTLDVLFAPLTAAGLRVGAIVLARDRHAQGPAAPADLDAVAESLVPAIEVLLEAPADREQEDEDADEPFDRVSSLHRVLSETVDRGDDREVLARFAEALIAWDGLEVRAYAEDLDGQFVLEVATPGADRSRPRALPGEGAWNSDAFPKPLDAGEESRLGFPAGVEVRIAQTGVQSPHAWRLAFSGRVAPSDEPRLGLYVSLLSDALAKVATVAETRTTWAVLQQLVAAGQGVEPAGEAALAELRRAVDATGAALVVSAPTGLPVLSLGDGEALTAAQASATGHVAVVSQPLDGVTMMLAARRPKGQNFARREAYLVERVAAVFAAWLPGVLKGLVQGQNRRTEARGFDVMLERTVARSLEDGLDVAVLVIAAPAAAFQPGLLQEWVGRLRAQLRASDLAGALSEREIGVLLSGVGQADISGLRTRLLRNARIDGASGAVAIGTACRAADAPPAGSLVQAARQDAAHRAQEPNTAWP